MRPYGSPKSLEKRRCRAIALLEQGHSLSDVARALRCHPSSVMRWRDAYAAQGQEGLAAKPVPGRPGRLTAGQKERLTGYLLEGATAHGYRTDLWTTQRIANLIAIKFKVRYHRDHIGRLMRDLGWTHQKPERRALERNEEAIERWKRQRWPQVKKTPTGWAPISPSSTNRDSC